MKRELRAAVVGGLMLLGSLMPLGATTPPEGKYMTFNIETGKYTCSGDCSGTGNCCPKA